MPEQLKIFVSYSHEDKRWLERLQVHLKPLVRKGKVDLWDDTRIKAGQRWKEEVQKGLAAADVAILLISADFLASDFVVNDELPDLLAAAAKEHLLILSVIVGRCRFEQTRSLSVFQAVNDPKRPLASIPTAKRDDVFVRLTERIDEALSSREAEHEAELPRAVLAPATQEAVPPPPPPAEKPTETAQPEVEEQKTPPKRKKARKTAPPRAKPPPAALPKTWENALGMSFVRIPAGTFEMGLSARHTVTISQAFYLGVHTVTQGQWEAVMGDNPSSFKGKNRPVEQVSWRDVQEFIRRLKAQEDGGDGYRLPTEAEWEYACRAGTTGDYAGDLDAMAWYSDNSGGETHPVGRKAPNAFGLYDMHGNVWEWVADWYGDYPSGAVTDPKGPESGSDRVVRGGGWYGPARYARSADRDDGAPGLRVSNLGFRLVRTGL